MSSRVQWSENESRAVCAEYHKLVLAGNLPKKAEEAWSLAQKNALSDHRRWRPFYSSSASQMKQIYLSFRDAGAFNEVKRGHVISTPAPEPRDPRAEPIQITPFLSVRTDTYQEVVKHHARNNPPKPATLDEVFTRLMDERIKAALPEILGQVNVKLGDFGEDISVKLDKFYGKLMRQIDPNWKEPEIVQVPVHTPISTEAPRKNLVVLVNPRRGQADSIQRDFPQFDFRIVEGHVPNDSRPFAVIGFGAFMSDALKRTCKGRYGDDYIHIDAKSSASHAKNLLQNKIRKGEQA